MPGVVNFINDHKTGYKLTRGLLCPKNMKLYVNDQGKQIKINRRTYYRKNYDWKPENKYVILVRHPYEIVASGYKFHINPKFCHEEWSYKLNYPYKGTGKVYSEGKKSYRQILQSKSRSEGLKHEMRKIGKATIMGMYNYPNYDQDNVLMIRFEDLTRNFDVTIRQILEFIEVADERIPTVIGKLKYLDFMSLSEAEVKKNIHITNKNRNKYAYQEMYGDEHYLLAKELFPVDLLSKFGYQSENESDNSNEE